MCHRRTRRSSNEGREASHEPPRLNGLCDNDWNFTLDWMSKELRHLKIFGGYFLRGILTGLLNESIKDDGYTMSIVCYYLKDEDKYEIVDGYHRYAVMLTHIECMFLPARDQKFQAIVGLFNDRVRR